MPRIEEAVGRSSPFIKVQPPAILAQRAPTTADTDYPFGQVWLDQDADPSALYTHTGNGVWEQGGNAIATNTVYGLVQIDTDGTLSSADDLHVPTALAAKTYTDSVAVAGAPVSTETTAGIGELATDPQAVAGTASTALVALFVTPSNLAPVFAAAPAIGGTTPAAGAFTTLGATGAVDFDAGGSWESGGTTIDIGADASGDNINLGTGAASRTMVIGNTSGTTSLAVNVGTGDFALEGNVASAYSISATGVNTGLITIGGGTGAQTLNLMNSTGGKTVNVAAGAGANLVTIGSANTTSSLDLLCGTGDFTLEGAVGSTYDISATGANTGLVRIASGTGARTLELAGGGTGAKTINIGAAASADLITIGTSDGAGSLDLACGTGDFTLEGNVASTYDISNTGVNTGTVNIAGGTGVRAINIGAGGTGAKTIGIGAASSADVITIGTSDGAGSLALAAGTGNFTLEGDVATTYAISATGVNTGTVTIGAGTGARIVNLATGGTGIKTVNIATAAIDNIVTIGTVTGTASLDLLCGTGDFTLEGDVASTYDISNTGVNTGTVNIAGGTGVRAINIGAGGTGAKTIGIGAAASADVITIGTSDGAGSLALAAGTGNFTLEGDVATTYAISATGVNTGTVTIGAGTGARIVNLATGGTGIKTVNIATAAIDNIVTIGTVTGTASLDLLCGTGDFTLEGDVASTYDISSTGVNTGTVTIASGTGARIVEIGGGGTGIKTINIGAAATADAITIGTTDAAGTLSLSAGTGGISLNSGQTVAVTTVATAASPYAVLGGDYFINTNSTGGALTITLPAAPATGRSLVVYDGVGQAAVGGNITVDGNGNNVAFAGASAATQLLNTAYESMTLVYNGTIWCARDVV